MVDATKSQRNFNALPVIPENIPAELKKYNQWVVWQRQLKDDGKYTKVPYDAKLPENSNYRKASSVAPKTWTTFEKALQTYRLALEYGKPKFDGIGFVLTKNISIVGLDCDKCKDPVTGELDGRGKSFASVLQLTYQEISPSGLGLRALCCGNIAKGYKNEKLEMYQSGRFLTITGHTTNRQPLNWLQATLDTFIAKYFPEPIKTAAERVQVQGSNQPLTVLEDQQILENCRNAKNRKKFNTLWSGQGLEKYVSLREDGTVDQSSADIALCSMLAFYTSDVTLMKRIFSSSGLYRDKWEREDYSTDTCEKAIAYTTKKYKSPVYWELPDTFEGRPAPKVPPQVEIKTEAPPPPVEPVEPVEPQTVKPTEAAPKAAERRRRGFTLAELRERPDPIWQVPKHFFKNSLIEIVGASGTCKSFFALDMCLSLATGQPFLGVYETTDCPVVYICSEGESGFKNRVAAYKKYYNSGEPTNFIVVPFNFNLLDKGEGIELVKIISQDLKVKPGILVIDTLARNFGDGDENSTKDMNKFVKVADWLREVLKTTVAVVHHAGWVGGRERGSTALRGAADTVIMLDITDGQRGILVKCAKQKDAEPFEQYTLAKEVVDLGHNSEGEAISSLVLLPQDQWRTRFRLLPKHQKDFLDELHAKYQGAPFTFTDATGRHRAKANTLKQLKDKKMLVFDQDKYTINNVLAPFLTVG